MFFGLTLELPDWEGWREMFVDGVRFLAIVGALAILGVVGLRLLAHVFSGFFGSLFDHRHIGGVDFIFKAFLAAAPLLLLLLLGLLLLWLLWNAWRVWRREPSRGLMFIIVGTAVWVLLTALRVAVIAVDPSSPNVVLLSPAGSPHPYYVEHGWVAETGKDTTVPGPDTVWKAQSIGPLTTSTPVTLTNTELQNLLTAGQLVVV